MGKDRVCWDISSEKFYKLKGIGIDKPHDYGDLRVAPKCFGGLGLEIIVRVAINADSDS